MNHPHAASLLVVPLLLSASLLAQTRVGGPMLADTTWTLAGSPYDVVTPVVIGNGAVLTIDPGVTVRLEVGKSLTVGSPAFGIGTILARGTAAQPIRFTSRTRTVGDWHALLFSDEAVDATLLNGNYVSGSILKHCIVEYAGGGTGRGAIWADRSAPFLLACTVRNNAGPGIYADLAVGRTHATPAIRIEGCIVQQTAVGSAVYLVNGTGHTITGCSVTGNRGHFAVETLADGVTISDCTIANNNGAGGILGEGQGVGHSLVITRNSIVGNRGSGIQLNRGTFSVTRNMIAHNRKVGAGGGILLARVLHPQIITIHRNTIANNTAFQGGGIYQRMRSRNVTVLTENSIVNNTSTYEAGGAYFANVDLRASRNTISGNHAGTEGGGMFVWSQSRLSCNTFADNTAGQKGGGIYVFSPIAFAGNPTNNKFNTLIGNAAPKGDAIYNKMSFSSSGAGNIDASFVCWGPNDPNVDANRIWDHFDDSTLGIVAARNHVVCDPFADLGLGVAGAAGTPQLTGTGPLTRNSALTLALTSAAPQSLALLLIDGFSTYAYLPFLDAVIVPLTTPIIVPLPTDLTGAATLRIPSLGTIPRGLRLYFQTLVVDPTAKNTLFAVSNGLLGITQ